MKNIIKKLSTAMYNLKCRTYNVGKNLLCKFPVVCRFHTSKLVSVVVAISLLLGTIGNNAYAVAQSFNNSQQEENTASKFSEGKITSCTDAGSNATVVNIQDLHCHYQTQQNINTIIKEIEDNYGIKAICVEGGYGQIDTSWLSDIKDENLKQTLTDKLLEDGELTGAEYYVIKNNKKDILKGLDEEKTHKENIKRLSDIIENENKYAKTIERVNYIINRLNKKYVNRRSRKFTDIVNKYRQEKIDTAKYYGLMLKYIEKINKEPQKYNNIIKISKTDYPNISKYIQLTSSNKKVKTKQVTVELQQLLTELKQKLSYGEYSNMLADTKNLKHTDKLISYIQYYSNENKINLEKYVQLNSFVKLNYINNSLNPVEMIKEEALLEDQIRKALSYNLTEYEIAYITSFEQYFEKYLNYGLTCIEWKYFETGIEKFRKLYAKYAVVDRIKEIEKDFDEINKYYQTNETRNSIFIDNITKYITDNKKVNIKQKRNAEQILKDSKEIIVVVSGGYHSEELKDMLSDENINDIVITPNVLGDIDISSEKYKQIIKGQGKIQSQALAYTLASCATSQQQKKLFLNTCVEIIENSDIDNQKAIEELSSTFGVKINYDKDTKTIVFDENTENETKIKMDTLRYKNKYKTDTFYKAIDVAIEHIKDVTNLTDIDEIYKEYSNKLVFAAAVMLSDSEGFPSLETEKALNENFEQFEDILKNIDGIDTIEDFFNLSYSEQNRILKIKEQKKDVNYLINKLYRNEIFFYDNFDEETQNKILEILKSLSDANASDYLDDFCDFLIKIFDFDLKNEKQIKILETLFSLFEDKESNNKEKIKYFFILYQDLSYYKDFYDIEVFEELINFIKKYEFSNKTIDRALAVMEKVIAEYGVDSKYILEYLLKDENIEFISKSKELNFILTRSNYLCLLVDSEIPLKNFKEIYDKANREIRNKEAELSLRGIKITNDEKTDIFFNVLYKEGGKVNSKNKLYFKYSKYLSMRDINSFIENDENKEIAIENIEKICKHFYEIEQSFDSNQNEYKQQYIKDAIEFFEVCKKRGVKFSKLKSFKEEDLKEYLGVLENKNFLFGNKNRQYFLIEFLFDDIENKEIENIVKIVGIKNICLFDLMEYQSIVHFEKYLDSLRDENDVNELKKLLNGLGGSGLKYTIIDNLLEYNPLVSSKVEEKTDKFNDFFALKMFLNEDFRTAFENNNFFKQFEGKDKTILLYLMAVDFSHLLTSYNLGVDLNKIINNKKDLNFYIKTFFEGIDEELLNTVIINKDEARIGLRDNSEQRFILKVRKIFEELGWQFLDEDSDGNELIIEDIPSLIEIVDNDKKGRISVVQDGHNNGVGLFFGKYILRYDDFFNIFEEYFENNLIGSIMLLLCRSLRFIFNLNSKAFKEGISPKYFGIGSFYDMKDTIDGKDPFTYGVLEYLKKLDKKELNRIKKNGFTVEDFIKIKLEIPHTNISIVVPKEIRFIDKPDNLKNYINYGFVYPGVIKNIIDNASTVNPTYSLSIFEPLKDTKIGGILDKYAHIWENIFFIIPIILTGGALLTPFGISVFAVSVALFLFSHTIVRWIKISKALGKWNIKTLGNFAKEDLKDLSIPTLLLAASYIIPFAAVSIVLPLVPVVLISTAFPIIPFIASILSIAIPTIVATFTATDFHKFWNNNRKKIQENLDKLNSLLKTNIIFKRLSINNTKKLEEKLKDTNKQLQKFKDNILQTINIEDKNLQGLLQEYDKYLNEQGQISSNISKNRYDNLKQTNELNNLIKYFKQFDISLNGYTDISIEYDDILFYLGQINYLYEYKGITLVAALNVLFDFTETEYSWQHIDNKQELAHAVIRNYIGGDEEKEKQKQKQKQIKSLSYMYALYAWNKFIADEDNRSFVKEDEDGNKYIEIEAQDDIVFKIDFVKWVHICDAHSPLMCGNEFTHNKNNPNEYPYRDKNSNVSNKNPLEYVVNLDTLKNSLKNLKKEDILKIVNEGKKDNVCWETVDEKNDKTFYFCFEDFDIEIKDGNIEIKFSSFYKSYKESGSFKNDFNKKETIKKLMKNQIQNERKISLPASYLTSLYYYLFNIKPNVSNNILERIKKSDNSRKWFMEEQYYKNRTWFEFELKNENDVNKMKFIKENEDLFIAIIESLFPEGKLIDYLQIFDEIENNKKTELLKDENKNLLIKNFENKNINSAKEFKEYLALLDTEDKFYNENKELIFMIIAPIIKEDKSENVSDKISGILNLLYKNKDFVQENSDWLKIIYEDSALNFTETVKLIDAFTNKENNKNLDNIVLNSVNSLIKTKEKGNIVEILSSSEYLFKYLDNDYKGTIISEKGIISEVDDRVSLLLKRRNLEKLYENRNLFTPEEQKKIFKSLKITENILKINDFNKLNDVVKQMLLDGSIKSQANLKEYVIEYNGENLTDRQNPQITKNTEVAKQRNINGINETKILFDNFIDDNNYKNYKDYNDIFMELTGFTVEQIIENNIKDIPINGRKYKKGDILEIYRDDIVYAIAKTAKNNNVNFKDIADKNIITKNYNFKCPLFDGPCLIPYSEILNSGYIIGDCTGLLADGANNIEFRNNRIYIPNHLLVGYYKDGSLIQKYGCHFDKEDFHIFSLEDIGGFRPWKTKDKSGYWGEYKNIAFEGSYFFESISFISKFAKGRNIYIETVTSNSDYLKELANKISNKDVSRKTDSLLNQYSGVDSLRKINAEDINKIKNSVDNDNRRATVVKILDTAHKYMGRTSQSQLFGQEAYSKYLQEHELATKGTSKVKVAEDEIIIKTESEIYNNFIENFTNITENIPLYKLENGKKGFVIPIDRDKILEVEIYKETKESIQNGIKINTEKQKLKVELKKGTVLENSLLSQEDKKEIITELIPFDKNLKEQLKNYLSGEIEFKIYLEQKIEQNKINGNYILRDGIINGSFALIDIFGKLNERDEVLEKKIKEEFNVENIKDITLEQVAFYLAQDNHEFSIFIELQDLIDFPVFIPVFGSMPDYINDIRKFADVDMKEIILAENNNYLNIEKNKENKDYLISILNKNIDAKFKLYALNYLITIHNIDKDELDKKTMETIKENFVKEMFSKDKNIKNNFDLKAYATGIFLLITGEENIYDKNNKDILSKIMKQAVFVRKNPEDPAIANDALSFIFNEENNNDIELCINIAHELGHNIYDVKVYNIDNFVLKTFSELHADVCSNIFVENYENIRNNNEEITDIKNYRKLVGNKNTKYPVPNVSKTNEHYTARGINTVFDKTFGKDMNWALFAEIIKEYFNSENISSAQLNITIDLFKNYINNKANNYDDNQIREFEQKFIRNIQSWETTLENIIEKDSIEIYNDGTYDSSINKKLYYEGKDNPVYLRRDMPLPENIKQIIAYYKAIPANKIDNNMKKRMLTIAVFDNIFSTEHEIGILELIKEIREAKNLDEVSVAKLKKYGINADKDMSFEEEKNILVSKLEQQSYFFNNFQSVLEIVDYIYSNNNFEEISSYDKVDDTVKNSNIEQMIEKYNDNTDKNLEQYQASYIGETLFSSIPGVNLITRTITHQYHIIKKDIVFNDNWNVNDQRNFIREDNKDNAIEYPDLNTDTEKRKEYREKEEELLKDFIKEKKSDFENGNYDGFNYAYIYYLYTENKTEKIKNYINDKNNKIEHRLYALMYLKNLGENIDKDTEDKIKTDYKQKIQKKDYRKNIKNNFDLKAHITGMMLIFEEDFAELAKIAGKSEKNVIENMYKEITNAIFLGRLPVNYLIKRAYSDLSFSVDFEDDLNDVIIHELMHIFVKEAGFENENEIGLSLNELFAYISSNEYSLNKENKKDEKDEKKTDSFSFIPFNEEHTFAEMVKEVMDVIGEPLTGKKLSKIIVKFMFSSKFENSLKNGGISQLELRNKIFDIYLEGKDEKFTQEFEDKINDLDFGWQSVLYNALQYIEIMYPDNYGIIIEKITKQIKEGKITDFGKSYRYEGDIAKKIENGDSKTILHHVVLSGNQPDEDILNIIANNLPEREQTLKQLLDKNSKYYLGEIEKNNLEQFTIKNSMGYLLNETYKYNEIPKEYRGKGYPIDNLIKRIQTHDSEGNYHEQLINEHLESLGKFLISINENEKYKEKIKTLFEKLGETGLKREGISADNNCLALKIFLNDDYNSIFENSDFKDKLDELNKNIGIDYDVVKYAMAVALANFMKDTLKIENLSDIEIDGEEIKFASEEIFEKYLNRETIEKEAKLSSKDSISFYSINNDEFTHYEENLINNIRRIGKINKKISFVPNPKSIQSDLEEIDIDDMLENEYIFGIPIKEFEQIVIEEKLKILKQTENINKKDCSNEKIDQLLDEINNPAWNKDSLYKKIKDRCIVEYKNKFDEKNFDNTINSKDIFEQDNKFLITEKNEPLRKAIEKEKDYIKNNIKNKKENELLVNSVKNILTDNETEELKMLLEFMDENRHSNNKINIIANIKVNYQFSEEIKNNIDLEHSKNYILFSGDGGINGITINVVLRNSLIKTINSNGNIDDEYKDKLKKILKKSLDITPDEMAKIFAEALKNNKDKKINLNNTIIDIRTCFAADIAEDFITAFKKEFTEDEINEMGMPFIIAESSKSDMLLIYKDLFFPFNDSFKLFLDSNPGKEEINIVDLFAIDSLTKYSGLELFNYIPKEQENNLKEEDNISKEAAAILPETENYVNKAISKGQSSLRISFGVAVREFFKVYDVKNFYKGHKSIESRLTALFLSSTSYLVPAIIGVAGLLMPAIPLTTILIAFIVSIFASNIGVHVILDFKAIKTRKELFNTMSNNMVIELEMKEIAAQEKNEKEIVLPVYIMSKDLEGLGYDNLRNTGLKTEKGESIFAVEKAGTIILGTRSGAGAKEIAQLLNESKVLEDLIKDKIGKNIKVKLDIVVEDKNYIEQKQKEDTFKESNIIFEDGIIIVNEIKGENPQEIINEFKSLSSIKQTIGFTLADKMIISLESIEDKVSLRQALNNGKARKVITKQQMNDLDLSETELFNLRESGIEVYIKEGDKIKEFDTKEEVKDIEKIDENITIQGLQEKIITSEKSLLIDINQLKDILQNKQTSDILEVYDIFETLIGNVKTTFGIGQLTEKDVEEMAYNVSYKNLETLSSLISPSVISTEGRNPSLSSLQSFSSSSLRANAKQSIEKLEKNNEIKMIYNNLPKDKQDKFITTILNRIKAKEIIEYADVTYTEQNREVKKLEKLLIKNMEEQQKLNFEKIKTEKEEIKETIESNDKTLEENKIELWQQITEVKDKEKNIALMLYLMDIIADDNKQTNMVKKDNNNIARDYRAMLSAA